MFYWLFLSKKRRKNAVLNKLCAFDGQYVNTGPIVHTLLTYGVDLFSYPFVILGVDSKQPHKPKAKEHDLMKTLTIISGILLAVAGVAMLFSPGMALFSIGWLVGVLLLVYGISLIANYAVLHKLGLMDGGDLFLGIVTAVLGVFLLFNQPARFLTEMMIVYMLGIWMVVGGILRIVRSIRMRSVPGSMWGWTLALGILMIVLGVIAFAHPVISLFAVTIIVAMDVLIAGIDLISLGASLHKTVGPGGETRWTLQH